jgi:hypothetical protein
MKYVMLFIIAVSLLYGVTAEYHETYVVEPGTIIEVHNINGNIVIGASDNNKVEVNVEKKTNKSASELEKVTFDISVGEKLIIKTRYLEEKANVTVTYDIKVPTNVHVGSISTANGSIELEKTTGNLILHTANGDIIVEDHNGSVKAQTSNGDITTDDTDMIVEAITSNGRIEAELTAVPEEGIKITSSNGSIILHITKDADAEINAATSNGRVSIDDLELIDAVISKKSVVGILGKGGPEVHISTSNGTIYLEGLESE